ncbi:MAG: MATE family efflux transporter [Brevinema sp.]
MPNYKALTKRITPLVLGIGIPASLRSLSQYIQQIIDTMYIGQYNSESLLAISSVIIPFWMFESIWIGITASTTVMIAQRIGAKQNLSATKTAQMTFILGAILSLCYFIFWQNMSGQVAQFMNLSGTPASYAVSYIKTVSFLYLFRFVGIGAPGSILEALGNTKMVMWATLAQSITNILLDPLLIWGWGSIPELGIKGAAIATVCAEAVAFLILSSYFWKHNYLKLKHTSIFPLQFNGFERFKLGIPITVEVMIWSLSTSTIISMMNFVYPLGGAIFNVGFLLSDMCYRLLYGFDIANMSLMGRSFGAKRRDRMIATLRAVTKTKWITGIGILITVYIFRYGIVRLFSNDTIIIQTTLDNFTWILAIALVTLSVGINMSTLNSMGYARYCLYVSMFAIPLRVLLSYWVLYHTNIGIIGIWAATIVEEVLRIYLTYIIRNRMLEKYWNIWKSSHP